MTVPYQQLFRLSDDTGLFEHARGPIPKRWHGYCVDDVARGLIVVCREPDPTPELLRLGEIYLAFLMHAQGPSGGFHNRMAFDRTWSDEPAVAEWWGRALWGLGTAVARARAPWMKDAALVSFERGVGLRSPIPHAMAYAALGAAEVATVLPTHEGALALLADTVEAVGRPAADPDWPWPHPRLTYADARLPEALLAAGAVLGDTALVKDGLRLLDWLVGTQVADGHYSVTPAGGWAPGDPRPAFHQQSIELAALADACDRAFVITGDPKWAAAVDMAVRWFLGDNDGGVPMIDSATGGGYDGLRAEGGRNRNQGAESTLSMISVLQLGERRAGGL